MTASDLPGIPPGFNWKEEGGSWRLMPPWRTVVYPNGVYRSGDKWDLCVWDGTHHTVGTADTEKELYNLLAARAWAGEFVAKEWK